GLLDGGVVVKAVDDVQVQVIGAQPPEGAVDLPQDGLAGKAAGVEVDLGGDHHLVPGDAAFEGAAQIFFAGARRVAVGGVEKVDAQLQRVADDLFALGFVQGPVVHGACLAKAHAAHTELGNGDVGFAQFGVFHRLLSPFSFCAGSVIFSIVPAGRRRQPSGLQRVSRPGRM